MQSNKKRDFTEIIEDYFGKKAGLLITGLYFFCITSILMVYSIALNNDMGSFLLQIGITKSNLAQGPYMISIILGVLIGILLMGEKILLRIMELLVYPLMLILLLMSAYLIPSWNLGIFKVPFSWGSFGKNLLMTIPLLVFAMNFSPAISTLVVSYKDENLDISSSINKINRVIIMNSFLLLLFVMFFVFSCILSLSDEQIRISLENNLSVMSIFGRYNSSRIIQYLGPIISLVAIITSFLGHFLGSREGLNGIIIKLLKWNKQDNKINKRNVDIFSVCFLSFILWLVAIIDLKIVEAIGLVVSPTIAILLYILPIYMFHKIPSLNIYKNKMCYFLIFSGFSVIVGFLLGKLL